MDRARVFGLTAAAAIVLVLVLAVLGSIAAVVFVWLAPGLNVGADTIRPWTVPYYLWHFPNDADVRAWSMRGGMAAFAAFALGLAFVLKELKEGGVASKVGEPRENDAKLATPKEVAAAGMLGGPVHQLGAPGLLIGAYEGRWIVDTGDQHIAAPFPSGGGKTRKLVATNLLNWRGSVVALDIMEKLYAVSAGWRATFGEVFVFRPVSERTHTINIFDFVPNGPTHVTELQAILAVLVPLKPGEEATIWKPSAQALGVALAEYLWATPGQHLSFGRILRIAAHPDGLDRFLAWLMLEHEEGRRELPELCRIVFRDFLDCPAETRGGFVKNLTTALSVFLNPAIDAATHTTSAGLRIDQLQHTPTTLYLGIPLEFLEGPLGRLMVMMFDYISRANMRATPEQDPRVRLPLWFAPDEIGQLPESQAIRGITAGRNFRHRWTLLFQDSAQMRRTYGADATQSFLTNCDTRLVVATADMGWAKQISEAIGTTTAIRASFSANKQGKQATESEQDVPLVPAHKIRTLPLDQVIVVPRGRNAFIGQLVDIDADVFAPRRNRQPPQPPIVAPADHRDIERVPPPPPKETKQPARKPAPAPAAATAGDPRPEPPPPDEFEADMNKALGKRGRK